MDIHNGGYYRLCNPVNDSLSLAVVLLLPRITSGSRVSTFEITFGYAALMSSNAEGTIDIEG